MLIKKRCFVTLVELLITLLILSFIAGLVGIYVNKTLREQRFRTEVAEVADLLRFAQNLMLLMGSDVHVRFAHMNGEQATKMWMEVEGKMPWAALFRKPKLLKTAQVRFEDQLGLERGFHNDPEKIDVQFLSGGSVMSWGTMTLFTEDEALRRFICLPGYPSPISATSHPVQLRECGKHARKDFAEKLTLFTLQEIHVNDSQDVQDNL